MSSLMRLLVVCGMILSGHFASAADDVFTTSARNAILIDAATETILYEKAADEVSHPASLAKLMTLALVFDSIKRGALSPERDMTVSVDIWRRGGAPSRTSAMYLAPNSKVSVANLMRGVMVAVGNDAAMLLAEAVSGSEAAFVTQMNEMAKAKGLKSSLFANATGLPEGEQRTTARDMARLALHLVREYPEYLPAFAEKDLNWSNIRQQNRNPLIAMNIGADGFMTGFVEDYGYALVGTAMQGGQRLIVVVMGVKTHEERGTEARRLLEWGFRSFELRTLFAAHEPVVDVPVYGGAARTVAAMAQQPVHVLVPRNDGKAMTASLHYRGPLKAPVAEGEAIGRLLLQRGDLVALEVPVVAAKAVARGTLGQRVRDAFYEVFALVARKALTGLGLRPVFASVP